MQVRTKMHRSHNEVRLARRSFLNIRGRCNVDEHGVSLSDCRFVVANKPKEPAVVEKPKPGDIIVNDLGMKFAWIPPGSFTMGSPASEKGRSPKETQHRVNLTKGFRMGVHPVTQK